MQHLAHLLKCIGLCCTLFIWAGLGPGQLVAADNSCLNVFDASVTLLSGFNATRGLFCTRTSPCYEVYGGTSVTGSIEITIQFSRALYIKYNNAIVAFDSNIAGHRTTAATAFELKESSNNGSVGLTVRYASCSGCLVLVAGQWTPPFSRYLRVKPGVLLSSIGVSVDIMLPLYLFSSATLRDALIFAPQGQLFCAAAANTSVATPYYSNCGPFQIPTWPVTSYDAQESTAFSCSYNQDIIPVMDSTQQIESWVSSSYTVCTPPPPRLSIIRWRPGAAYIRTYVSRLVCMRQIMIRLPLKFWTLQTTGRSFLHSRSCRGLFQRHAVQSDHR